MKTPVLLTTLLAVGLSGCGESDSAAKAKEPAESKTFDPRSFAEKAKKLPRHQGYDLPWEVDLRKTKYGSAETKRKLLVLDAAVRKITNNTWHQRAEAAYPFMYGTGSKESYRRTYKGLWWKQLETRKNYKQPNHSITIELSLSSNKRIHGYLVMANRRVDDGWSVRLHMSNSSLHFYLKHPKHARNEIDGGVSLSYRDKGGRFRFNYSSRPRLYSPTIEDTIPFVESASSFRAAWEGELDRLEKAAREYFGSEDAGEIWTVNDDGTEEEVGVGASLEVREAELEQVLKMINGRRALIAEHHQEIYQDIMATMPGMREALIPTVAE